MLSRPPQPNAADAVPGVRRRRYGINRQPTPPLPDARTSSFWPALELLGIDPNPQLELGGHVTPGGPPPPPATCATCYELNVETGKCERIANCEEDDGGNIIPGPDDTEGGQCSLHGSAVWNSVSNQCECPDHLPDKIFDSFGNWTDCGESGIRPCSETHGPGYTRIDGTCVPNPDTPCTGADDPRLSWVNTCASHGWASASPPQYENRNGICFEVGCDKTVKENGVPRPESYPCADGKTTNLDYSNGRCPEEGEHPPGAPFGGDPESGPAAPRGDYTPVGPENEDLCSDRAYALQNPTICGGRGPDGMSEDMKRSACNARGGQWKTDAGLDVNPAIPQGPGVCVGYHPQPSQKKCPDGRTYPRQHEGGVCPRVRRRSRSGSDQSAANIPDSPDLQGSWG